MEEITFYEQAEKDLSRTEEQARALARFHSLQTLKADWPDAEILARKEDALLEEEMLHYRVVYTITADICG